MGSERSCLVERQRDVHARYERWAEPEGNYWRMYIAGSPWRPSSKSGSLLLICGLLFALVIYNAYAAFITSVLSVKTARIKGLEDLIYSDFAFGYTLGNTDELFLRVSSNLVSNVLEQRMKFVIELFSYCIALREWITFSLFIPQTVNDSLLRELYFMGLRKNDGVKDPIMGMHRAGKGEYAFFVAARFGRRALRRDVAYSQRCDIQELILPITRTVAAIPMSRKSAIKKIMNFRYFRLQYGFKFGNETTENFCRCSRRKEFNNAPGNGSDSFLFISYWKQSKEKTVYFAICCIIARPTTPKHMLNRKLLK